jgi:hypothetical protein
MTAKNDTLFLTESEIAKRIGLNADQFKNALPALQRIGFPQPDPLFADRRYWPAIQAFLDRRAGLASGSGSAIPARDEVEPWKR